MIFLKKFFLIRNIFGIKNFPHFKTLKICDKIWLNICLFFYAVSVAERLKTIIIIINY